MQEQQIKYWAFLADPKLYKIEKVVREQKEEYWPIPRRNVRAGDRAIIWKGKGNDQHGGIVALAEVLTDPLLMTDPDLDNPDFSDYSIGQGPPNLDKLVNRVKVRYWTFPTLPLWEDGTHSQFLKELGIARAHGGTVFHVTPNQWNTILELVGGWPVRNPEAKDAELIVAEDVGKRRSGQGYSSNPEQRRAIELYAMQRAIAFYEEHGWSVFDMSSTHPYDLLCRSAAGKELHVEVKGTTSDGAQIFLTVNEVKHAQSYYPNVALFILSRIQVGPTVTDKLQGGEIRLLEPWNIDEGTLSPLTFAYSFNQLES